ncbi:MAG: hypothetical protein ACXU82_12855 [Caulobacteraceae bacterium]
MTGAPDDKQRSPLPGLHLGRRRPALVLALLALTLAAMAYGLWLQPRAVSAPRASVKAFTDVQLHRDEIAFARTPATYYDRVIGEQRFRGYPLKPFAAVRTPVLAFALAWLPGGETSARLLIGALAAAAAGLWTMRLMGPLGTSGAAAGGVAMASGVVTAFTPNGYLMHECWSGQLIALSLALHPGERTTGRAPLLAASLLAGLAAALVRELALPFLGVMALMALVERRPKEALLWLGAIGLCLLVLFAHAVAVLRHTLPTDPGMAWVRLGGWPFLLAANRWNAIVALTPWLAALLPPAALAGALAWAGPIGRRLGFILLGYAAGFLVVGRPEDTYWGLMIAPLLPLGWAGAVAYGARLVATPIRRHAESPAG